MFSTKSVKMTRRFEWKGSLVSMELCPRGEIIACGSQELAQPLIHCIDVDIAHSLDGNRTDLVIMFVLCDPGFFQHGFHRNLWPCGVFNEADVEFFSGMLGVEAQTSWFLNVY